MATNTEKVIWPGTNLAFCVERMPTTSILSILKESSEVEQKGSITVVQCVDSISSRSGSTAQSKPYWDREADRSVVQVSQLTRMFHELQSRDRLGI